MENETGIVIEDGWPEGVEPISFEAEDPAASITIPEGTLAYKNNNPGNLRFVGQQGASEGEGGFASFETPEAGYQALENQISLDASRGHTLGSFINKYAPPSENDTDGYVSYLEKETGYNRDDSLEDIDVGTLSKHMSKFESGTDSTGGNVSAKPANDEEPVVEDQQLSYEIKDGWPGAYNTAGQGPSNTEGPEQQRSGIMGALGGGFQDAARNLRSAFNVATGDDQDVMDIAQQSAEASGSTAEMNQFRAQLAEYGDPDGLWDAVKNVAASAWDNPAGAMHEAVAQLPNSAAVMGPAAVGVGIGTLLGPVGSAVGGMVGGLVGMAMGNIAIETGAFANQQAGAGEYDRGEALLGGMVKGGVVTAVDGVTMGVTKWLTGTAGRAFTRAAERTLINSGIDVANKAAVTAAMSDPIISKAVAAAGKVATDTVNKGLGNAGRKVAAFGGEILSEGVGEYSGSALAPGMEANLTEAVLESVLSMPNSVSDVAIGQSLNLLNKDSYTGGDPSASSSPEDAISNDPERAIKADADNDAFLDAIANGYDEDLGTKTAEAFEEEAYWNDQEAELKAQREGPEPNPPMTLAQRNQQSIDQVDAWQDRAVDIPETDESGWKKMEDNERQWSDQERLLKAQREGAPLPKKNQARINAALSDEEQVTRDRNQQMAGKSDTLEKIDKMQTEVNSSETKGVTQERVGEQSETVAFSASSPGWMQEIQQARKSRKAKALSRKELNVLFDKTKAGQPLTERQQEQFFEVEQAIEKYTGESGEFVEQEKATDFEKEGYEVYGGQEMPVSKLKINDEFSGTVNGESGDFKISGIDNDGIATIQGKESHQVDVSDNIKVDAVKRAPVQKFEPVSKAEMEQEGYEVFPEKKDVAVADFKKGDKVIGTIDGVKDEYIVRDVNDNGDVLFQDGVTRRVDMFDEIEVNGIKVSGQTEEAAPTLASEPIPVPTPEKKGASLFTAKELEGFAGHGIDISGVTAKYKKEALQQLGFSIENEKDLNSPGYNDRVRSEYRREAQARKEPVKKLVPEPEFAREPGEIPEIMQGTSQEQPAETPQETNEGPVLSPGSPVSWKTKSGKEITGTLLKKNKKYWSVQKDKEHGGKKTLIQERSIKPGIAKKAKPSTSTGKPQYGQGNKVFTEAAATKARELLKKKLSGTQLNSGVDPEIMLAGIQLAGYHIEAGSRTFAKYSKAMVADIGENIKPYLRSFYEGVRHYPGFDSAGMDSTGDIDNGQVAKKSEPGPSPEGTTASNPEAVVSDKVLGRLNKSKPITSKALFGWADEAYNGTQGDGSYSVKDAYDAAELGMNKYLASSSEFYNPSIPRAEIARARVNNLELDTALLPTQTKRTTEQNEYQQFSTPPAFSFVANWIAKIKKEDVVLEPSAGIGGLAVFAKNAGAKVYVNELSTRRAKFLNEMGFDGVFSEDAAQLDNILPDEIKPSVIVMNPPFSATAGRTKNNKTMNGAKHLEQALARLEDGGRLVAIVGQGMAMDAPTFKDWWAGIKGQYNVRANIGVDGKGYVKYGTTFDNQLIVIDKTGKTGDIITEAKGGGKAGRFSDLITALAELHKEERTNVDQKTEPGNTGVEQTSSNKPGSVEGVDQQKGDGSGLLVTQPSTNDVGGSVGASSENGNTGRHIDKVAPGATSESDGSIPDKGKGSSKGPGRDGLDTDSGRRGLDTGPVTGLRQRTTGSRQPSKSKITASVYDQYSPNFKVEGSQPHITPLVESAAMADTKAPENKYIPNLPKDSIESGKITDAQIEAIAYAGRAHNRSLPDGTRKGFFIGDGTGVGKGREISGIIWNNWRKGRRKAIWLSEKASLLNDAKRDLEGVGWNEGAGKVFGLNKIKPGQKIPNKDGILFTQYATLRGKFKDIRTDQPESLKDLKVRLNQIVDWAGKDYDGVIAFDEAHNMGNVIPVKGKRGSSKPSSQALAGVLLQELLPQARVVYVSATGATEVQNLAYAPRLGLWGDGTPFANVLDFVTKIAGSGVSAMELVARDMKSLGLYIARSLSYADVKYNRLEHKLSPEQTKVYDTLANGWQSVLENIDAAVEHTSGGKDQKSTALSQFWGAHQRFFNQIITAMQMPTTLKQMEADIANGSAIVAQLVNTNDSQNERAIASLEEGQSLEDLDMTPRDTLMRFLERSFPIQQYESYTDENDNERTRQVYDSNGNPVINKQAERMKNKLMQELGSVSVPSTALDMIIQKFGPDVVAEVTGRKRRIIINKQGEKEIQKWSDAKSQKDIKDFMDDKKKILIFSEKGGTGSSYHAALDAKNTRLRRHYLIQPGWRADKAVQGLGRSHRSFQKQAPEFVLVTTDLPGQKRFLSSIARRLDQLGALTKGQRQTGGQGIFAAKDNLESSHAKDALSKFFENMTSGKYKDVTPEDFQRQTGIALFDFEGNTAEVPEMTQFLNRMLSMTKGMQEAVFNHFSSELDAVIQHHADLGTLDVGLETITADSIRKVKETVAYSDKVENVEAKYVQFEMDNPAVRMSYDEAVQEDGKGFYSNLKSGKIRVSSQARERTDPDTGAIESYVVLRNPKKNPTRVPLPELGKNWEKLSGEKARSVWEKEYNALPTIATEKLHMLTGTLLPLWDRLQGRMAVSRLQTDDGQRFLGRKVDSESINSVLENLGMDKEKIKMDGQAVAENVLAGGSVSLHNNSKFKRSLVAGENRIEYLVGGQSYVDPRQMEKFGLFSETIQWKTRWFVPSGDSAGGVIDSVMKGKQIVSVQSASRKSNVVQAKYSMSKDAKQNSIALDNEYMDAVNLGDMETAQQLVNEAAALSGLPVFDESKVTAYKVRRSAPPKKTTKAYKLFRAKKSKPGEVFALFVGAADPLPTGVWLDATAGPKAADSKTGKSKVKSKLGPLAYRPGWHAGDAPLATHIGAKSPGPKGKIIGRKIDEVWAEVDMAADVDYQPEATGNGTRADGKFVVGDADIKHMPTDGLYRYKTNPAMTGRWIISGSMKVNRILSEAEVNMILKSADQPIMPWAEKAGGKEWKVSALDLNRWGLSENPAKNQKKLLDTVTYDDNGNVVPLSKRFDVTSIDPRYSWAGNKQDVNQDQGITIDQIKGQFPGQQITETKDGSLSIRFKNGKGVEIKTVENIGGEDIKFAIKTGRMEKGGAILGKYRNSEITLDKNLADIETTIHENLHMLVDLGILTKFDLAAINRHHKKLVSDGTYRYETQNDQEENQANTMAQMIHDRATYRDKSMLNRIIQKVWDFLSGLAHIGRQSARKLAVEYESGDIYSRGLTEPSTRGTGKLSLSTDRTMAGEEDSFTTPATSTLMETIKHTVVDNLSSVSKVYDAIQKPIAAEIDFRRKEQLRVAKAAKGIEDYKEKYETPIKRAIAMYGLTVEKVDAFLYARHAPEANERLRRTNAKAYLNDLASVQKGKGLKDKIQALEYRFNLEGLPTKELQEAYISLLESELGSGSINQHIKEAEQGVDAAEATGNEDKIKFAQNRLERANRELRVKGNWDNFKAKPSGMTDGHADAGQNEAADLMKKWGDNKGMLKIAKLFDRMNDEGLEIAYEAGRLSKEEYRAIKGSFNYYAPLMREGYEKVRGSSGTGTGVTGLGKEVKARGGSTKRAVHLLANGFMNHQKRIINAEKAKVAEAFLDFVKANPNKSFWEFEEVSTVAGYDGQGNIVRKPTMDIGNQAGGSDLKLKVRGKVYRMKCDDDNVHAKRIFSIIRGDRIDTGRVLQGLARLNRFLAAASTTYNPAFVVSNLTRDVQTAILNIESTPIAALRGKVLKGVPKALMGLKSQKRGDKSHEWASWADRYEKSGAKIGWIDNIADVEVKVKDLESQIDLFREGHKIKKGYHNTIQFIEDYNSIVENSVRLSAFRTGIEAGMTDSDAAYMAKDLTVNFNQKGSAAPVFNSLYLFSSAGIQGSARIIKNLKHNPKKMAKILGGAAAFSASLALSNSMLGGEDDDGMKHYDKIDDHVKSRNIIIMDPFGSGKYLKIPLPWGYNVFWAMGTELGDMTVKDDYEVLEGVSRMLTTAADAFNPLQSATLGQTVSPTFFDPIMQVSENKAWHGGPLRPEQNRFAKVQKPDSQLYFASVRTPSKYIAEALNWASFGNKVKPGFADVSPETLDMLWDTFTGGAGKFWANVANLPVDLAMGKADISKTPIVRRFVGKESEYKIGRDYRENITHVYQLREQAEAYPGKAHSLRKDKTYNMYLQVKHSEKQLKSLRKQLKRTKDNAKKDIIRKRIGQIQKRFNKIFYERRNA